MGYLIPVCILAVVWSDGIKVTFVVYFSLGRSFLQHGQGLTLLWDMFLNTFYAVDLLTRVNRVTAVAGTKFTNPGLVWLSQTFVHYLIFITAVSRGGVARQDVVSYFVVCLMSAPFGQLVTG